MKKNYILSVLTLIAIAVLSLMPAQEFPETDVPFADKWVHWVMYGFLTAVMIFDCSKGPMYLWHSSKGSKGSKGFNRFQAPSVRSMVVAMIAATLYGGLMEVLQATVTTTRSGDWYDALADAFGALCTGVFFLFWKISKT